MKDSNALDERVGAGGESRYAACGSVRYFFLFNGWNVPWREHCFTCTSVDVDELTVYAPPYFSYPWPAALVFHGSRVLEARSAPNFASVDERILFCALTPRALRSEYTRRTISS